MGGKLAHTTTAVKQSRGFWAFPVYHVSLVFYLAFTRG